MRDDLSYAEHAATSSAELSLVGWGPRADRSPLASPGQPGSLEISQQDAGMVRLAWKKPRDGGKPAFYKAEVRTVDPPGDWTLKGTATSTKMELAGLNRAVQLEFRIIAENSAGSGPPGNTASAVL